MKKTPLNCRIPEQIKQEIADSKLNEKCCLWNFDCSGRIQWHHNLIHKGKRVNEPWAILGVCEWHHQRESTYKNELNWIMLNRATDEQLQEYSKAVDYVALKQRLNKHYGN